MATLFDLPWEDILFRKVLPFLTWKDLFYISSTCSIARDAVSLYFTTLKKVEIDDKFNLLAFQKITQSCAGLRILRIRNGTWINDSSLCKVFVENPNLQVLDLSGCSRLTGHCFQELGQFCRDLKILGLSGCNWVKSVEIQKLISLLNSATLEQIDFTDCPISHIFLITFILHFSKLKKIRLARLASPVTDTLILSVAMSCRELTNLDVRGSQMVTDHGIKCLVEYSKCLTWLEVRGCPNVTEVSLRPLRLRGTVSIDIPPPSDGQGVDFGIMMQV